MAKRKSKKKTTRKYKKTGLIKGNKFLIPRYIQPPETILTKIWTFLNKYAFYTGDK